ncbi:MAG: hypothetical protein U0521_29775 [Anaerolineae bacterium]
MCWNCPAPLLVRRAVAFGDAAVSGVRVVEGVQGAAHQFGDQVDDVRCGGRNPC